MELLPLVDQPWLLTGPSPAHSGAELGGWGSCLQVWPWERFQGSSRFEWHFWGPNLPLRSSVPLQCLWRNPDSSKTTSQGLCWGTLRSSAGNICSSEFRQEA